MKSSDALEDIAKLINSWQLSGIHTERINKAYLEEIACIAARPYQKEGAR